MKNIMKKLKSSRGETLVESLVSILIFTLASILFLTMVNSAARINETAKKEDTEFHNRQQELEMIPTGGTSDGSIGMTANGMTMGETYPVYLVGGEGGPSAFYPFHGEGETEP